MQLSTVVLIILIVMAVGSSILSLLQNEGGFTNQWWSDWLQNFSTEMLGAVITFGLIELLVGGRRASVEQSKLQQLHLSRLRRAETVKEKDDILSEMKIRDLLKNADLQGINLQEVNLSRANLQRARLQNANLQSAKLNHVDFKETNLENANLTLADLSYAQFNQDTILPDSELVMEGGMFWRTNIWTKDTDMLHYTNPEHPNFWEPSWVKKEREEG